MAISARLIRFAFNGNRLVTAATFGLYGVMMGIIFLTLHLCSLRSFGVPVYDTNGSCDSREFRRHVDSYTFMDGQQGNEPI